ncbi:MAG: DUF885 domain-containing protein [Candidatus Krumholzibacteria bacterium]|nr:DUF885 domain-containing protein [Candidatus Krumholzibacteria bacterium]
MFGKKLTVIAVLVLTLILASCGNPSHEADARFTELASNHLERLLELNPEWATNLGDHRFDAMVSDLSEDGFEARADFNRDTLAKMKAINPEHLSLANRIDYATLQEACESTVFEITELREHRWNPTIYNPGDGLYNILARDYAPLPERLKAVKSRLAALPEALAAARANLDNPPRVMTETAISQNPGVINLVMDGLQEYLAEVPEMQDEFQPVRARAIAALDDYGRWLQGDLLPRSNGDFRLGKELWEKKLRYSLSSNLSPQEILVSAEKDLQTTRDQMYEIALPLYRDYFGGHVDDQNPGRDNLIRRVLVRLSEDRPTNETIVPEAREGLKKITRFVAKNNLVTVPDNPVEIIVMPEHQRGFAIGYCDSPGPLEENGTTFYAISPTPKNWSAERAETFYREYNDYMLQNLTVHEAMPGHYLQIAHANNYEADTPLRAIFSSGTFVEGWATYAEQLMVEAGYGGPEVHLQQLKMRLRLIINSIIDQKIHTAGMTEGEAMEMMMVEGFQEEGEAAGKWIRAGLSSTQLSTYYVGNLEINRIRHDYEAKNGGKIDLKKFHDELLSFGSPAPKHARVLMGLD